MEENTTAISTGFAGVFNMKPIIRCYEPDRYLVEDIYFQDFTISRTTLFAGKSTKGHRHQHEELYYYISGQGRMTIDEDDFTIFPNMFIRVPGNAFHRVVNQDSDHETIFLCIWSENVGCCKIVENTLIEKILTADLVWATT